MIKAVIFDYGNVIARVDHSIFLRRIAQASALPLDEVQATAYRQPDLLVRYESGQITSDEFYTHVAGTYGLSMSRPDFRKAFVDIFERIQPTIQLIQRLKPLYTIGLLSNTNEWHYKAEIETLEVFSLFDSITVSFEVGAMKPDARIFHDALGKLSLPPEACAYIDDIPQYVSAAQQLGMHAIQYTSHEALLSSLSDLGVSL